MIRNNELTVFLPSGKTKYEVGKVEGGEKITRINTLSDSVVSLVFEDETEKIYSGFPFIIREKKIPD
jgi:hypothetical protein